MHPGSANDVAVNAQERKNTTSDWRSTYFLCTADSERRPKTQNSSLVEDAKNTQTQKYDASTSTHFYAHPYTRKRITHTRDCNLIDLYASHNIHLHIVSHIVSAYFGGRGFVCMFVCRKTDALTDTQRTTSNEKKT